MSVMNTNNIRRILFADRWRGIYPTEYRVETWHSPRLVHRLMRVFLG